MNTLPPPSTGASPPLHAAARAMQAYERSDLDEAERLCHAAIAAEQTNFDAHHLLAVLHARHGRHGQALASYNRALAIRPDDPQALSNRGVTLDALGRYEEALATFDRALAIRPDYPPALSNRGNALRALQRPAEALASYDRALAIRPDFAEALSNRGTALHAMQRYAEALASYDKALGLQPDHSHALSNRGLALQALRRPAEALASFDKALGLQPDYAECHCNRALALFLLGCFGEAWREYEWRRKTRAWAPREFAAAEWQGESLQGQRLLLYAEQGLGDTIQFARFAPLLAERGAEVILEVQPPLARVMETLEGVRQVARQGQTPPEIDRHLPLLSVPFVLGLDETQIPAAIPYLRADPVRVEAWAKRLPKAAFRIGIAWQGNPMAEIDRGRSIPLAAFAPLASLPGVRLISLQKHEGTEQLSDLPPGMRVAELGEDFDAGADGFLDSAAVMMHLDLVITSDNTIAHLAGALGRNVWIVLQEVPECRWMLGRTDTPWYPTARLFRQRRGSDWTEVFTRVAAALQRLRAGEKGAANRRARVVESVDIARPAAPRPQRKTIPAFVISLARRQDRRERFFRWNANKGLDITVFDAVDGQTLQKGDLFRANLIDSEQLAYTPGALGIALSHRRLWEMCRDSQERMIIFEDDAFLPDVLRDWLEQIDRELNTQCDLLYLGYNRDAIISLSYGDGEWFNLGFVTTDTSFDEQARQHDRSAGILSRGVYDARLVWGILAYAITPQGAETLLQHCFPLSMNFSVNMYGSARQLTAYGIDGIMNTLIQRGIIRARAIFPPLVIGPNDPRDSDAGHRR